MSLPKEGDPSPIVIHSAVGKALTDWERLDRNLADIFSLLVAGYVPNLAASRAYGSVLSVRGRIEMIQAAGAAVFADKPNKVLRLRLKELLEEAEGFAARRNDIAHGITSQYLSTDNKPIGYVLGPGVTATRKVKLTSAERCESGEQPTLTVSYAYTAADIDRFGTEFARLRHEAMFVKRALLKYVADPSTVFGNERFGRPSSPQTPE